MTTLTIRNLPESTRRALKARAKRNARSTEAEVRAIIEESLFPPDRVKLGTLLYEFGRKYGPIEIAEDDSPVEPADFS
ncbi:MAG: Arc family DNA-binding protein [Rhizobiales bacterium]|nr:Arc family DNA-binding protein [Hyphomicrobiales bacterium]